MVYLEGSIALADVATATRTTVAKVEDATRTLGMFVGEDWAGRPSIEERDARALVDGSRRREQEAAAAWVTHQAATEAWEAQRRDAYLTAHAEAYRAAGGPRGGRVADRAAQAAGDAAVVAWERKHPAPTWQGEQTATLWRRVVDAVAGVAS